MKYRYLILGCAAVLLFVIFSGTVKSEQTRICRDFLSSYGWETEKEATDAEKIKIPVIFDEVYKNYNLLQLEAGLDLLPYCGTEVMRYTYVVLNYPLDVGEAVYANVICAEGRPIAGDIMTVSMNGFMHSLVMPQ